MHLVFFTLLIYVYPSFFCKTEADIREVNEFVPPYALKF